MDVNRPSYVWRPSGNLRFSSHLGENKIRLDKQTLVELSQNNKFNNDATNAQKAFNSNESAKLQIAIPGINKNKVSVAGYRSGIQ